MSTTTINSVSKIFVLVRLDCDNLRVHGIFLDGELVEQTVRQLNQMLSNKFEHGYGYQYIALPATRVTVKQISDELMLFVAFSDGDTERLKRNARRVRSYVQMALSLEV